MRLTSAIVSIGTGDQDRLESVNVSTVPIHKVNPTTAGGIAQQGLGA